MTITHYLLKMLNQQKNEQLIKDKLFLERVFLLEIDKADRLFVENNLENFSPRANRRSIIKIGLLLVYSVLIILLSQLSPVENFFSSISASLEQVNKATVDEVISKPKLEIAKPIENQLEVKKTERAEVVEIEKILQQVPELVLDKLPPVSVPPAPLDLVNSTDETLTEKEFEEILLLADLVLDQLPPLPVPRLPVSISNAEIPPTPQVVDEFEDDPEPQAQINLESKIPEVTVTKEIEPKDIWLGEANVVYHASISANLPNEDLSQYLTFTPLPSPSNSNPVSDLVESEPQAEVNELIEVELAEVAVTEESTQSSSIEALEQINTPVAEEQIEHSLNDDLRQYLTSTPLSSQLKSNPVSVSIESEPQPEVSELIEAEIPEVAVTEVLETELASPSLEPPLFADEDLRKYLTSPLYSDDVFKERMDFR